jgi:hypothetical protein
MSDKITIQEALAKNGSVYISITGLKINGLLSIFGFWRHAIPSKIQADKAPGLILVDLKKVGHFHHTLSVWENKEAMLKYLRNGAHLKALKVFRKIATGRVFGYEAQSIPTWDEALGIWSENARTV